MTERDFEWFEQKYPGWYDEYGDFWEAYRTLQDPDEGVLLLKAFLEEAPPLCWTCQTPAVIDEDICHRVVDDRTRFYCSKECKWMDESNPGRYTGDRNFFDRYHGWELSDVIRDLGFVRADGKTLLAQPHLKEDKLWTLADLKRCDVQVTSPNINYAKSLGLPSGDWSDHPLATAGAFYSSTNGIVDLNGHPHGNGHQRKTETE
jgi:propane monooxygenase large subunit